MTKRIISLLLALTLVVGILPAYAADEGVAANDAAAEETAITEETTETSGADDAAMEEYIANLGEFTETPANAYTPGAAKNLVGAELPDHAYTVDFDGGEDVEIAPAKYVEGEILYAREDSGASLFGLNTDIDSELAALGITNSEEIYTESANDGVSLFSGSDTTWYKAEVSGDVEETVKALENVSGIADAEPNYIFEMTTEGDAVEVLHHKGVPHENERKHSWFMRDDHDDRRGMRVREGWEKSYEKIESAPGSGVVIAVIDTGVDYTHEDIASSMWTNAGEIQDNGIDDDGNGYVDDYYGMNATASPTTKLAGNPMDDNGHGTHVAGIIAMANNGVGGVGVAYGAKIMAIKAGYATGTLATSNIVEAVQYAVMMGADVINMSFGGTGRSSLLEEALQSAFTSCVLVAAAGNDNKTTTDAPAQFIDSERGDFYPAGYTYVLGVMASDENGNKASFSNWDYEGNTNAEYEIIAPGTNIYSTIPGNRYASWKGTSMAAPTVAAAAAVIRSNYPDKNEYNSRFIMGQLASASDLTTTYVDKLGCAHTYTRLDLYDSLTRLPKPNISLSEVFALDNAGDGDRVIDAGETIDLGIEIRNQWGKTGVIKVKADAISDGGVANPFVTFVTDEITLDPAGTFSSVDNGYVHKDGLLEDVSNPIRFVISEDCPNDTQIKINLTVTTTNGMDETDTTVYEINPEIDPNCAFTFRVQRGVAIKGALTEDTTLTADKYWIVENSILIPEGITMTVEPGTQIQFYSSDYESAYGTKAIALIQCDGRLDMIGAEEAPIELFPGAGFEHLAVEIYGLGIETLKYCKIVNLGVSSENDYSPINIMDHCSRIQYDYNTLKYRAISTSHGTTAEFAVSNTAAVYMLSNTKFMGKETGYIKADSINTCLMNPLDGGLSSSLSTTTKVPAVETKIENTVYTPYPGTVKGTNIGNWRKSLEKDNIPTAYSNIKTYSGAKSKYFSIKANNSNMYFSVEYIKAVANSLGGTLACINDKTEDEFLHTQYSQDYIGYYRDADTETYYWEDGSTYEISVTNEDSYYTRVYLAGTDKFTFGSGGDFVCEVPSELSDEEILAGIENFDADAWIRTYYNRMSKCAILNPILETDTASWFYFRASGYNSKRFDNYLFNNYWGTENKTLINKMIMDEDDYATEFVDIIEDPILTLDDDLSSIYPFVTEVYVTETGGTTRIEDTAQGETYEVHVKFNRDMAQDSQPTVTYGGETPFTDYAVSGDWVSAREWVGTTKISSIATGGTMIFRTSGAAAADDKWLECGADTLRFSFDITASSALSMVLNAVGEVDKVELSWIQNDYELLGGYNLYRSTKADSGFTKINGATLTDLAYTDTDVAPGVTYYYYFTVVDTMGNEIADSKSNIAEATPLDNIKPTITHTAITSAKAGQAITVSAKASDNIAVGGVRLFYRIAGDSTYSERGLTYNDTTAVYTATVPKEAVTAAGVEYYLEVYDSTGNRAYSGSATVPYLVAVDTAPTILTVSPSVINMGTTLPYMTVYGTNFTEGMTVRLGTKTITEYTVSDAGDSITFSAPDLATGLYAVTIISDGQIAQKAGAVTYRDSASFVQINEASVVTGVKNKVPVYVGATGDITALYAEFKIPYEYYDWTYVSLADGVSATLNYNYYTDGTLKISMASATSFKPESSSLPLFYIELTPKKTDAETMTQISLVSGEINGSETVTDEIKTTIMIKPMYTLSVRTSYFSTGRGVPGINVTAGGVSAVTGDDGSAELTAINRPDITVSATCGADTSGAIDPMDAVFILRSRIGLETLSEKAQIAADVNADGKVNEVDASLILQYTVLLIDSFPAGAWRIDSKSTTLTTGTNLVILPVIAIGDVDGSWKAE